MDLNSITLSGRVVAPAEVHIINTKNGEMAKTQFRLAVKHNRENTFFINCITFGATMLPVVEHLTKGKRIGIEGRLNISQYEKDGQRMYYTEIIVNRLIYLDKLSDDLKEFEY